MTEFFDEGNFSDDDMFGDDDLLSESHNPSEMQARPLKNEESKVLEYMTISPEAEVSFSAHLDIGSTLLAYVRRHALMPFKRWSV